MSAADTECARPLSLPVELALHVLVAVAISSKDENDPHLVETLDLARQAIRAETAVLPAQMTPEIREVLGLMLFRTAPLAHVYRASGEAIPRKVEEEQAFVLFRFLHLALSHGPGWFAASCADVKAARAAAESKLREKDSA